MRTKPGAGGGGRGSAANAPSTAAKYTISMSCPIPSSQQPLKKYDPWSKNRSTGSEREVNIPQGQPSQSRGWAGIPITGLPHWGKCVGAEPLQVSQSSRGREWGHGVGDGLGRRCFGASSKEERTGTGEMSSVRWSGLR